MGLVAIWCMHYVGNRAIALGTGCAELQLVYSPLFTALSSVIPVVALSGAFALSNVRYRGKQARVFSLLGSGITAGMAIVGMHYVGDLGVSNYHVSFFPSYVGGAIAIACTVSTATLFLIFMLQDFWWNTFAWRICCAIFLAGAVSGMHFEASMGTTYRLKHMELGSSRSRDTNVIVATILSFDEDFNVGHPAFQWIYRASHNWDDVTKWVPGMRYHLQSAKDPGEGPNKSDYTITDSIGRHGSAEEADYSRTFRENFCVAASDLAVEVKEPLSKLGTLYDGVMMTGTLATSPDEGNRLSFKGIWRKRRPLRKDLENGLGTEIFGKGQVLFVVRRTERKDLPRMQSMGFRFVPTHKISDRLAHQMQVPQTYLIDHLGSLRAKCIENHKKPSSGTLLACFALRAGIARKNWEVVTLKDQHDQLPTVPLWSASPDQARISFLSQLEGMSVANCLAWLSRRLGCLDDQEDACCRSMRRAITDLLTLVVEPFFMHAIFSSKIFQLPVRDHGGTRSHCSLLAFHIVPDVHVALLKSSQKLGYTPFTFFRCLQHMLEGNANDASFRGEIRQEFANICAVSETSLSRRTSGRKSSFSSNAGLSKISSYWPSWRRQPSSAGISLDSLGATSVLSSTEHSFVDGKEKDTTLGKDAEPHEYLPFGGIMVSSNVTVETAYQTEESVSCAQYVRHGVTGTRAKACVAGPEASSFVDEMFGVTIRRWLRG
ncbi:MAG: hypothetical protein M1828_002860 [Chrysothrix sp. TS-e1954]|nr:MAG: hypothetical protein M1828_002860 [Chrysothrix sp. TS-e1954]